MSVISENIFLKLKNVTTFEKYIDNTESVSLFSQANLENSKKRGRADIFPRHITFAEWASMPRFLYLEYYNLLLRHRGRRH